MAKLLFEKKGLVQWGPNALLCTNIATGALAYWCRKIKIFDDHIEFKELLSTKSLLLSELDFVEIRTPITVWFAHHAKAPKFLSFTGNQKDIKQIIEILKSLNIKIKEEKKAKILP